MLEIVNKYVVIPHVTLQDIRGIIIRGCIKAIQSNVVKEPPNTKRAPDVWDSARFTGIFPLGVSPGQAGFEPPQRLLRERKPSTPHKNSMVEINSYDNKFPAKNAKRNLH